MPVRGKRQRRKAEPEPDFDLPSQIPAEPWAAFVEMREKLGRGGGMTNRAKQLMAAKLIGFAAKGHDIAAILNKSTLNNWTDCYEPKPGDAPAPTQWDALTRRRAAPP